MVCSYGCQPSSQQQATSMDMITVTTSDGQLIKLQQPTQRIVCLFEASLDDLYMLGAGKQVIGIPSKIYTAPDLYAAYSILDQRIAKKQIVTPSHWEASTNIESVLALQPDLVIVSSGQQDLIELLRQMHIAVYPVQSENLQQTQQELLDLGKLTGTQDRARQLNQFIEREIQAIQQQLKPVQQQLRVYYAWSGGRIFSTSGRNSMPNTVIQLAGAKNIVESSIDQPSVNPERLLIWDPDIILLWNSDPQILLKRPELQTLKAVRDKKVFTLSPGFLFNPHTPKILLAANQLHHWIYPDPSDAYRATQDKYRILTMFYGATAANQLMQLH
ncbi:ABC transporter substrate-binding protein [Acinetobacter qingfengensis]|uniref:Iron transporter n=2 Tax=Acinetobacter qingfengensis TaxID=1262585 RepID=A0A1E7RAM7_9GAMM|nr:ABC transporter substrate-binding protein [Acinetobacter qingfengensis]OEY96414.1 iron transporter [Acinetobacter qingfengensis]